MRLLPAFSCKLSIFCVTNKNYHPKDVLILPTHNGLRWVLYPVAVIDNDADYKNVVLILDLS